MITKINNIEELEKPEIVTVTYRGHGLYQYGLPNFPELYFEVPELQNNAQKRSGFLRPQPAITTCE